jgi:hypothetical protein
MESYLTTNIRGPVDFNNPCDVGCQGGTIELSPYIYNKKLSSFEFILNVTHDYPEYSENYNSANMDYDYRFSNYTPQNNIIINGVTYNNVYVISMDTVGHASPAVWQVYYTQAKGILQFNSGGGHTWTAQ